MAPLISVIIPVRNGAAYIEKAVSSALSQTTQASQIIVSDNGSTDATAALLSKYEDDPRIKVVRQTGQFDMFAHFNKCLEMVDTKYFMMLHHDDFLCDESALEQALAIMESSPSLSTVYCDLVYVDKMGKFINHRQFNRAGIVNADEIAKQSVLSTRNLFGIPLLIRSDSMKSVKYDNRITYAADLEFSIAVAKCGEILYIRKPLIAYRIHGENASVSLFRLAFEQMKLIALKHGISINALERVEMYLRAWMVAFQKWAYFQYLNKVRKY